MKTLFNIAALLILSTTASFATVPAKHGDHALLRIAASNQSSGVRWHNYSPGALQSARARHQPVVLFAITDTCQFCQQMSATTFRDSRVASMINRNFYPVILRADHNRDAFKNLQLFGVPTVLFLDGNGNANGTYEGYQDAANMIRYLRDRT